MAKEWGKYGIRVNAVAPGIIDTRMIQNMNSDLLDLTISNIALKTKGSVESVADVCSFLASDKSSYITGQVLRVDGGI